MSPARRPWLTVAVVASAQLMAVMSASSVGVALPTIGRALGASATELEWIVDAYVLVFASLLVAGGVLGDRRGRKGVFLTGVALFSVGSLVAGVAPTIGWLLAGRVIQGLGPALVLPVSLAIIRVTFEDERPRALAIGLWSMSSGLALAIGPALGGVLVDQLGWRWVFAVNVPIGALVATLAATLIVRVPRAPASARFDVAGALLITSGLAAIAYAIIGGQDHGFGAPAILAIFAAGAGALAGLAWWERRTAAPLIDVALFARPIFTATNIAALIVFFAFLGVIVYFSAYFQQVQGRDPTAAGLCVLPVGAAFALAAPLSGRIVGRTGPGAPMLAGLTLAGLATLVLTRLQADSSMATLWWKLALLGAGCGLALTPMTAIAVAAVEPARAGMASAIHNAMRQVGQVLGVAVLGALVYGELPGERAGDRLSRVQSLLFVRGLHRALIVAGVALLAGSALCAAALATRRTVAGRV